MKSTFAAFFVFIFPVVFLASLFPFRAFAHGSGFALHKEVAPYVIDVHYSKEFIEGDPLWLNFFLSWEEDERPAYFSDIDVSLMANDEVVLKTQIDKKRGLATGIVVTLPTSGMYSLNVIFNDGTTRLAEANFDINVSEGSLDHEEHDRNILNVLPFLAGFLSGASLGPLLVTMRRSVKSL